MSFFVGATSIKGMRAVQQDSFCHAQSGKVGVLALADGNGGEGGRECSEIAVKISVGHACFALSQQQSFSGEELKIIGLEAVNKVSEEVHRIKEVSDWQNAGTTLTVVLVSLEWVVCCWVGDSPSFLINEKSIEPLIVPHTLAEKLIQQGQPRELIDQQPGIHSVLTRCLGHDCCNPDVVMRRHDGSRIVVVGSDGFSNYVTAESIVRLVRENMLDVQGAADALVQVAFSNDSDDNVSVIVSSYRERQPNIFREELESINSEGGSHGTNTRESGECSGEQRAAGAISDEVCVGDEEQGCRDCSSA